MYVFYDFETLKNCFLASFKNKETGEWYDFVIYKERNDLLAFISFLKQLKGEIGYNCVKFDSQVQQWIIDNVNRLILLTSDQITSEIYAYATNVIEKSNARQFLDYPEWKLYIPQCDPFLINHYDNVALSTSLKWLQFSMNFKDIVEMDVDHKVGISTIQELEKLIYYCHNDIDSTELFYRYTKGQVEHPEYKGKDQILLRQNVGASIGKSIINWNNAKIGDYLNLSNYIKKTGKTKEELYHDKRESYKQLIYLKNVLPLYTKFKTDILNNLLNKIRQTSINIGNDEFHEKVTIGYTTYVLGLGGIHSEDKPRRIIPNENQILRDGDVGGQHPCAIVRRKIYPRHLSEVWYEQIKDTIDKRKPLKILAKKGDKIAKSWVEAYKEAGNKGGFGKLGETTSWQCDMEAMFSVTIGNQLDILMLVEELELNNISVLSANTDGIICLFDKQKEQLYNKICNEWEEKTGSTYYGKLEFTDYKLLVQTSVNDYLAVKTDEEALKSDEPIKYKGDFTLDPLLHKNKSRRIIPLSLKAFYVDGIDPKTFITSHKDIFDFCCAVRADSTMSLHILRDMQYIKQQKTCRYYVANTKDVLLKRMKPNPNKKPKMQYQLFGGIDDGTRENQIEAGYNIQMFNTYFDSSNYNINYNYYITKAQNIIDKITSFNIQDKVI